MVNTRQRDERSAADIAAVWPDDGGEGTLCGGLLYQRYSISSVRPSELAQGVRHLAPTRGIDGVNQKAYNTTHQMTARTDNSDLGRYSPAYATGRSAFALQSKSGVEVEQWNV